MQNYKYFNNVVWTFFLFSKKFHILRNFYFFKSFGKSLFAPFLKCENKTEDKFDFCHKENEIFLNRVCYQVFQFNELIQIDEMEKICDSHNSTLTDLMTSFSTFHFNLSYFLLYLNSGIPENIFPNIFYSNFYKTF